MNRSRGFSRLAEASAPVTDPMAMTELSRPKPLASLPNSIFAIVAVFVAAGMSASLVLTGRKLKSMQVPNSSVLLGGVLAIIGFFVIPVLGLPIGFVGGLYLAEYSRLKDGKTAWNSSWESIKAIGLGAAIEFALAMLAAITFGIGVLIHFFA